MRMCANREARATPGSFRSTSRLHNAGDSNAKGRGGVDAITLVVVYQSALPARCC